MIISTFKMIEFLCCSSFLTMIVVSTMMLMSSGPFMYDFAYYDLALQRCNRNSFTIHGLWPELTTHSWPEFCHKTEFKLEAIQPLVPTMNEIWTSCEQNKPNEGLWEHEWLRHGTCTGLSQFDFFNRTISLYTEAKNSGIIDQRCHYSITSGNGCLISYHLNFTLRGRTVPF